MGETKRNGRFSDRKGGETQLLKMNLGIKILTTGGLKNKWETYSSRGDKIYTCIGS